MTLLGQGLEALIQEEFNNPTNNFGVTMNDYITDETGQSLKPNEIAMFSNWQQEPDINGWRDLVEWIWYQIKRFIDWLFDLL